jgi:hypothetical protein
MRRLKLASVVLAHLVLAGCPDNPKPQTLPPGALNHFDATSYESLMGAQAVLNSVKTDYAGGKLPASAKPALNKAIASYNTAQAALAGIPRRQIQRPDHADSVALAAVADLAALLTQISGGKR